MLTEKPNDDFVIISKDQGYKSVIEFWAKRNKKIDMYVDLNKIAQVKEVKKEIVQEVQEVQVIQVIKEEASQPNLNKQVEKTLHEHADKVDTVTEIIGKYKTKVGVNNALVKAYNTEIAGNIYKAIKPLLSDKK